MQVTEAKWEIVAERALSLVGTHIIVVYGDGLYPYHVHRWNACHGAFDNLAEAKAHTFVVVKELLEMGVDP